MSDRILNFSEFFKRYSKQTNKENSLDTIMSSPQNFEDGFDETTYDKTQLGPNKPISTSYQATPAQPKFNKEKEQTMDAPDEDFDIEVEDEDETPEPEKMGANPAKTVAKTVAKPKRNKESEEEKVAESRILSFAKFSRTNEDRNRIYDIVPKYRSWKDLPEPEKDYNTDELRLQGFKRSEEEYNTDELELQGFIKPRKKYDGNIFGANPMDDEEEEEKEKYDFDELAFLGLTQPEQKYDYDEWDFIKKIGANPIDDEDENPYSDIAFGMNPMGDVYEEDMCPTCENPYEGTYSASANPGMKTCGGNPMTGSCGSNPYY
jgi:hypothetical protein